MKFRTFCLLIVAALLGGCAGVVGPTLDSENFRLSYAGISEQQAQDLLARAEKGLSDVTGLLKRRPEDKITIIVGEWDDTRRAYANHRDQTIEIPANRFRGRRADSGLVHEITHIVAGSSFLGSSLLQEGLAVYAHEKFSPASEARSGHKIDAHKIVRDRLQPSERISAVGSLIFDNFAFSNQLNSRDARRGRFASYTQAGSFVKYLVGRYGIGKFIRAYYFEPFDVAYGKDLAALETEWLAFLQAGK